MSLSPVLTSGSGLYQAASGQVLNAPALPASGAGPFAATAARVIQVVVTGLTTAAVTQSAAITVNTGFSSTCIVGAVVQYSGAYPTNGDPRVVKITPGTGSFTFAIYNANAANALAGNITCVFQLLN
jgi:hypothetical protein